jgi:hypothetical protein
MKAAIDDFKRRTVVGEIIPFRLDRAIADYNYDPFEISPNLRNRCVKNWRSAGDGMGYLITTKRNHPL